jgi:hypothetical protein
VLVGALSLLSRGRVCYFKPREGVEKRLLHPWKNPMSANGTERRFQAAAWMSAIGAKPTCRLLRRLVEIDPLLGRRASDLAAMRNVAVSVVGYAVILGGSP